MELEVLVVDVMGSCDAWRHPLGRLRKMLDKELKEGIV